MTLYIQRHAPTPHNDPAHERIRGWGSQGVSPEGEGIARRAAQSLRDSPPSVIFTSDLPRAADTARLVAKELGGVPVIPAQELRTWNVGDITGQPVKDAKPQLDALQHSTPSTAAPHGESYQDFYDRWGKIAAVLRRLGQSQDILAVVHGRQVYSLPHHLAGKRPTDIPTHGAPDPGDILAVNERTHTLEYVHRSGAMAKATV